VSPVLLRACAWGAILIGSALPAAAQQRKLPPPTIAVDSPHPVRFVDIDGVRVAYTESGAGDPVVFIHGNPTSSYLWRNVVPYVAGQGRTIALDLPGMGRSAKPARALRFADQVRVFEAFVERLQLRAITLVVHDWGAAIGFDYARRHPELVKGIAFMEGVLPPVFPQPSFEAMGPEMGGMFKALKDPVKGRDMVVGQNMFIEQVLPAFVDRPLGQEEMAAYREPFRDATDREAILMWPQEIPIAGQPADVVARMEEIRRFMTSTSLPMLLLYAEPGVLVPPSLVTWYTTNLHDLETVYIGPGLHFIQEDQPAAIGRALKDWLRRVALRRQERAR